MMIQLKQQQLEKVSAAGISEATCVASFGALGALGGFIGGGIFTGGIGIGPTTIWGFGLGTQLGTAICL
ncbi:MAG: hypothetical protein ACJA0G_002528 [Kangiellaceae bacterium]|jgi:hypothetical protein